MLVGGSTDYNQNTLVLRDLSKPLTDPTSTSRIIIAEEADEGTGIIYERDMQVGKIDGKMFAFINIVNYGLIAIQIDPENMTFGEPKWIVGGLGPKKEYKTYLPSIVSSGE